MASLPAQQRQQQQQQQEERGEDENRNQVELGENEKDALNREGSKKRRRNDGEEEEENDDDDGEEEEEENDDDDGDGDGEDGKDKKSNRKEQQQHDDKKKRDNENDENQNNNINNNNNKKTKTEEAKEKQRPAARRKTTPSSPPPLTTTDVPRTGHYEVSYMHRDVVTHVVASSLYGYVMTASHDGVVKFWKRLSAGSDAKCVEFVKSYAAHVGPVATLQVSKPQGDMAASIGQKDDIIKLYDVRTFDATAMIQTRTPTGLGLYAAFVGEDQSLIAVTAASAAAASTKEYNDKEAPQGSSKQKSQQCGNIYIFSTVTLSPYPVRVVRLHASSPITAMAYNPLARCMISADVSGVLEVWDCTLLRAGGGGAGGGGGGGDEDEMQNDTMMTMNDGDGLEKLDSSNEESNTENKKKDGDKDDDAGGQMYASIGTFPTRAKNGVLYTSKMDTDFYNLLRKRAFGISIAVSEGRGVFAVYGSDRKVRIWDFGTGRIQITLDERSTVYTSSPSWLDSLELGKRLAIERDLNDTSIFTGGVRHQTPGGKAGFQWKPQLISMDFDSSGRILLLPTLLGIKLIDWTASRSLGILGKQDASALRFLSACLCSGDAKVDRQMQLARSGGSSTALLGGGSEKGDEAVPNDSLVICLAHDKRRFYVFSHVDPIVEASGGANNKKKKKKRKPTKTTDGEDAEAEEEEDEDEETDTRNDEATEAAILRRDVLNEAPDAEDMLLYGGVGAGGDNTAGETESKVANEAILRTSMGDVHMKLFAPLVPRTVENFCGHARNGYYDNVLFHRVIKGFMIQTGDPMGDGTGGESIWGGEFEDEFHRDLRHDRPFTVSMANAGPNTNGSQFFITTAPATWLDQKHTVFGRVTRGMDVCSAIEAVKTDEADKPLTDIFILNIDLK